MKEICLNEKQEKIIDDLKQATRCLIKLHLDELKNERNIRFFNLHEPNFSNVLGIFGARGAGKSTLLLKLYDLYKKTNSQEDNSGLEDIVKQMYIIKPIDCSVLEQMNIPSTAVLLTIKQSLEEDEKNGTFNNGNKFYNKNEFDELLGNLDKIIGCCTRTSENYRDLCLELSTSPSDFDFYQREGIKERLDLKIKLQHWVIEARKFIGDKVFMVFLDDFDLSSVTQVHAWISGLLDELQQLGIIFILTADYHRLEHLSWDSKKQFDDKTGRALINKIFPPKHCIKIPDWEIEEKLEFLLNDSKKLRAYLEELKIKERLSLSVVSSLLPYLPRGLKDFYEKLPLLISNSGNHYEDGLQFSHLLATCRNEPLLAKLFEERRTRPWTEHLVLSEEPLSTEQWRSLIINAYDHVIANLNGTSCQSLTPLRNILAKDEEIKIEQFMTSNEKHAPLLHKAEYFKPLRDAVEADQGLWAELLFNLDFYNSISYRTYFIIHWKSVNDRLQNACFQVNFPSWELTNFFADNGGKLHKSTLCWIKNKNKNKNKKENPKLKVTHIGWQPLLESLRGKHNPLSSSLLKDLFINGANLEGELPNSKSLSLLPDKLSTLLVFSDALIRCPWKTFSKYQNWMVFTYIALAAAFVRSAYFYSLYRSQYLKKDNFSEIENEFINMIEHRQLNFLLKLNEQELWQKLILLFKKTSWKDELKEETKNHSLVKATNEYLSSTIYTEVIRLLEKHCSFYKVDF